jgi:PleD family two-component response regulator
MSNTFQHQVMGNGFAGRIAYELKRAERYRIFVSLVIFNIAPVVEKLKNGSGKVSQDDFLALTGEVIRNSVREIDAVSNSGREKIGLLFPETSRQGAESAARRISEALNNFYEEFFDQPADYLIPVEISSYPDASGARSLASYIDDFVD